MADCGLRLTHRTENLAWPGTQKKKNKLVKRKHIATCFTYLVQQQQLLDLPQLNRAATQNQNRSPALRMTWAFQHNWTAAGLLLVLSPGQVYWTVAGALTRAGVLDWLVLSPGQVYWQ